MATHRVTGDGVPEHLRDPSNPEWTKSACLEWLRANPGSRLPFGEHGDLTDVLVAARERRLTHPGA